ncbi:MAG: TetR/AcrR family transcriptional regulator [Terrimesophilobacter sp.]
MSEAPTLRSRAKANRREALLGAAARLFAERGYNGVSLEELGAAAGVSGPAVYRHFDGKQALLGALLVGVSEHLSTGGQAVVVGAADDAAALRALVQFHVDFALGNPDVIRVQGQDLGNLAEDDRHAVRALQRTYVELWVQVLGRLHPEVDTASLRIRAHAAFGLINSTPHSARTTDTRAILEQMALAGLASVGAPTPTQ